MLSYEILALFIAVASTTYFGQHNRYDGKNRKYMFRNQHSFDFPVKIKGIREFSLGSWFTNFNVHKNHLGEYVKAVSWALCTETVI